MPSSLDATVTSISAAFGKNEMKLSEVVEIIMTEKIMRLKDEASSLGSTLNMESRCINKSKGNNQGGRSNSKNWRSKSKHLTTIRKIKEVRKILIDEIVIEKETTRMGAWLKKRTATIRQQPMWFSRSLMML